MEAEMLACEAAKEEKWKSEMKNLMGVIQIWKGKIPTREEEDKDPKAKHAAKFVTRQRALWHAGTEIPGIPGVLDYGRMFELSDIPNWTWSQNEETWQAQVQNLRKFLKKGNGRLPSQKADEKDSKVKKAAMSINNPRTLHQEGELESDRVELLFEIDNWTWGDSASEESWEAQYKSLLEVIKKSKGRLPSQGAVETNPEVKAAARLVSNQRTLCKQGKLSHSQAEK
jgi:hypothetical protein